MRRIIPTARRQVAPIIGAPFSFRTLHAPRSQGRADIEQTLHLDKVMTITLPLVRFGTDQQASMMVRL